MRYYYRPDHPKASERGFVSGEDLGEYEAPLAKDAPIMMDRHYENLAATDGTDVGSRRKHREYMKRHGLTVADDFKETWAKARKERDAFYTGDHQGERKAVREAVDRALHQRYKS